LAVAQAGAFIHCHSSLSEYRELYRRERNNLLQNEETQGQDPYELAVYSTWRLSYDKLDGPARTFLQVCSLLHHEGISEEMFEKAAVSQLQLEDAELQDNVTRLLNQLGRQDSGWSSWTFRKVIMDLGSYSLIEYDHQNRTYSVHPLVHHWCGTIGEGNRYDMQKLVLTIIAQSFPLTLTNEDYRYRRKLLKHTINSIASVKLEDINPLVGVHIAEIYYENGHSKEAEALEVMVMEKRKQLLGADHLDTLESMGKLANTYWSQGRWSDAEVLGLVVLEKRKLALGDDHPDTLKSMGNLALTYWSQGRWKEAEALEMVVMEIRKRVLGDDHPHTLLVMGNLANTYRDQGRLSDAEALAVVVIEGMKRVNGEEHPYTLRNMSHLAVTYWKQGRLNDVEALQVVTMEKMKRVLGDDHQYTLDSMANLADTYRDMGRLKDAEALGLEVMEKMKRALRDGHPDTLKSMSNLAATYRDLGRLDDAEDLEAAVEKNRNRREST